MSLMNSSKLISHILGYLRITKKLDSINNILNIESIIEECLTELEEINSFKYIYRKYNHKLEFLEDCAYDSLFEKSDDSYYLIACTLGYEVEQRIKYLSMTDSTKMVIMDACASAYLEEKANEYEKSNLDVNNLDNYKRFCPGYGESKLSDLRCIYDEIKAEKIGIVLNEQYMMSPQKSMLGIVKEKIN